MIGITSLTISITVILYNLYNYKILQKLNEKLKGLEGIHEEVHKKLTIIQELELKILHLQEQIKIQNDFVIVE